MMHSDAAALTALSATSPTPEGNEEEQENVHPNEEKQQEAEPGSVGAGSPGGETQPPVEKRLDRYDYDKTTILLVAQLRPVKDAAQPRAVWLSVQNGVGNERESPLWGITTEEELGAWPPVIAQLLGALRDDLPARQSRAEARRVTSTPVSTTAARPPVPPASSPARTGKTAAKHPVSPPPLPTTSDPIPKDGLAMSGLFEGLD